MTLFTGIMIVLWTTFLIVFMAIGGYFMFRKFLKSMPKKDGWSELDWQDYYIEQTRELWTEDGLKLLQELVSPVPELFRDVARRSIAAKIGQLAWQEKAAAIDHDLIIRGYIIATPARDYKFLIKRLEEKNIDYSAYEQLLNR